MMNRERARDILLDDGNLMYHCWWYSKNYMSCGDGCCDDSYDSVEDVLDNIEAMSGGDWSKVDEA